MRDLYTPVSSSPLLLSHGTAGRPGFHDYPTGNVEMKIAFERCTYFSDLWLPDIPRENGLDHYR